MKKILWISMCLPYKKAGHAGGKTVDYYATKFANDAGADIKMICKVRENELNHIKDSKFGEIIPVAMPRGKAVKAVAYISSINSKFNPLYKYGNTLTSYIYKKILRKVSELKTKEYYPEIIILEWTEMVMLSKEIRNIFPKAKIVASEHDVKFQSAMRQFQAEKKIAFRWIKYLKYINLFKRELESLDAVDLVVTQSVKDKNILQNNGISEDKQLVISPYFMDSKKRWVDNSSQNVVIYGDMSRPENYLSAIWYIEKVQPLIKNTEIALTVLGGNPPQILKKYESERIHVTGFVEDVFEYMSNSFCMVVPLQLGAGIKVKCLEALNYGIPLLTNEIGIEGIGAKEGTDYILCKNEVEFAENIDCLYMNKDIRSSLSVSARQYAVKNLNLEESFLKYRRTLDV